VATNILMPALSPTMEEGKLARWLVKEGDTVKSGDILAEIETDKATMEFEAVDEGRIGKLLVAEGSEGVKVNSPIAVLLGEGEKAGDVDISAAMKNIGEAVKAEAPKKTEPPKPAAMAAPAKPQSPVPAASATAADGRIFASPLARRIAAQKGIALSALQGTGPRGRIVKADLENAKPGAQALPAATRAGEGAGLSVAPLPDAKYSTSLRTMKRLRTIRCARRSHAVSPRPRR
jgi:pyruvate dehydrogenase E2 component (dihydrolipoamide acetyltransferase)